MIHTEKPPPKAAAPQGPHSHPRVPLLEQQMEPSAVEGGHAVGGAQEAEFTPSSVPGPVPPAQTEATAAPLSEFGGGGHADEGKRALHCTS